MKSARTEPDGRGVSARGGFTLIELMVVVLIIAALAGLLLPAIRAARINAQTAEVRQEISQLEAAIADFKAEFGQDPPSTIQLFETGNPSAQTGWYTNTPLARQSRATIRALWPKFNFTASPGVDLNGNGSYGDSFILKGDQCLVFFLGGMYNSTSGVLQGFSTNSANPFTTGAGTRIGPFFQFNPSRVRTSIPGLTYSAPLTNFPVYVDTLPSQTRPYLYASSYNGRGYKEYINSSSSWTDGDLDTAATLAENPNGMSVYRIAIKPNATAAEKAAWLPNKFQIISPGFDNKYGIGGPFLPDGGIPLPNRVAPLAPNGNRSVERDNITNFHSGQLSQ